MGTAAGSTTTGTARLACLMHHHSCCCLRPPAPPAQVAAVVYYVLCESFNKNQFVLNFVVCIVLIAMDFWTVRGGSGCMR